MNKKYLLLASFLVSNTCMASFVNEDDTNQQIVKSQSSISSKKLTPQQINLALKKITILNTLFTEYFTELAVREDKVNSCNQEYSFANNYCVTTGKIDNRDWNKVTNLLDVMFSIVKSNKAFNKNTSSMILLKEEESKANLRDYWNEFVDIRNNFRKNSPFKAKNFDNFISVFARFVLIYRDITDVFDTYSRSGCEYEHKAAHFNKLLQESSPIINATFETYINAYQKYQGPICDNGGAFRNLNGVPVGFNADNRLHLLLYVKQANIIKPFILYGDEQLGSPDSKIWQTSLPESDISNIHRPFSTPLIKWNRLNDLTFIDKPGVVILQNEDNYLLQIYYGLKGNKGCPYTISDRLTTENFDEILVHGQKSIPLISATTNCDQDLPKSALKTHQPENIIVSLDDQLKKNVIQRIDAAEKLVNPICKSLSEALDVSHYRFLPWPHNIHNVEELANVFNESLSEILDGQKYKFLPLPRNIYDIELQELKSGYAKCIELQNNLEKLSEEYLQLSKDRKIDSGDSNITNEKSESVGDEAENFDEIQTDINVQKSELNVKIKYFEEKIFENCKNQAKLEYDAKIANEQIAISKQVVAAAAIKEIGNPNNKSLAKKSAGKNNRRNNNNNYAKKQLVNEDIKQSQSLIVALSKDKQIIEASQEKSRKIIDKLKVSPKKAMTKIAFSRMLKGFIKAYQSVGGGNVTGQLNGGSHGKINFEDRPQSIAIVRSHGSSKDNKISVAQIEEVQERFYEEIEASMSRAEEKMKDLEIKISKLKKNLKNSM